MQDFKPLNAAVLAIALSCAAYPSPSSAGGARFGGGAAPRLTGSEFFGGARGLDSIPAEPRIAGQRSFDGDGSRTGAVGVNRANADNRNADPRSAAAQRLLNSHAMAMAERHERNEYGWWRHRHGPLFWRFAHQDVYDDDDGPAASDYGYDDIYAEIFTPYGRGDRYRRLPPGAALPRTRQASRGAGDPVAPPVTADREPVQAPPHPAPPKAAARPATPKAAEQPTTSKAAEQPAAPQAAEQPAAPKAVEQRSAPQGAERPAAPQTAEQPAAPQAAEQPAAPQVAEQPAPSKAAEQPATSKTAAKPATSKTAAKPATSKTAAKPATSKTAAMPATSKTAAEPVTSKTAALPATSKAAARPATARAEAQPATSKATDHPAMSKATAQPTTALAEAQPVTPKATEHPATSKTVARPTSAQAEAQPTSKTTDRPATSKAAAQPAMAQLDAPPAIPKATDHQAAAPAPLRPATGRLAQLCSEDSRDIAGLPIDEIQRTVAPDEAQLAALDDLGNASMKAAQDIRAGCPTRVPATAPARLAVMQQRVEAMIVAVRTVQPALDKFYDLLNDEQKASLEGIGPNRRSKSATLGSGGGPLARNCGSGQPGTTEWPTEEIEARLHPTDAQRASLTTLIDASAKASEILKEACRPNDASTPSARLTATGKRLEVMLLAIKTVLAALDDFYDQLTEEQKAEFEVIGPGGDAPSGEAEAGEQTPAPARRHHGGHHASIGGGAI